jgi:hypothetical protein
VRRTLQDITVLIWWKEAFSVTRDTETLAFANDPKPTQQAARNTQHGALVLITKPPYFDKYE